ncbi:MAG TPA: CBS domain-containing protein [Actinomycetota bacterium]|jgi:CBS domain-containing protein
MQRTVQDVMTRTVVVVNDSAPFKEVVRLMQESGVSALPVVDAGGRLVGIVSEGDLILKEDPNLEGEGHLFESRQHRVERQKAAGVVAAQLMTAPVITVAPDAALGEAARLMHHHAVKRLPVVGPEGTVVGIVSRADLLKVFLREDAEIAHQVTEDIIRRTLWIDPATIQVTVEEGVVSLDGQIERRSLIPVLVGLVRALEGVVGVENHLSYLVDDTTPSHELPQPWTALTPRPGH